MNGEHLEQPRGPLAWMTTNHVAANLLMVVLLVGGLIVGKSIKQEVFPSFSTDTVTVSVSYPGASPEEVEQSLVLAIEQAVEGLEGIEEVTSTASEGSASVRIEAVEGTDIERLWQEIKSEVDRITTFPEEAKEPSVTIDARRREVVSLGVYGDVGERSLHDVAERLEDELLKNPEITQVDLSGVRDFEIHVEIAEETLRRYGLTISDVADRIATASVELGGGSMKTSQGEILIRVNDRRDYASEFGRIPIVTGSGGRLLLEDLATITEGFEDSNRWADYNGHRAVMVDVYRVGEQTPISVAEATAEVVEEFQASLPPGVGVATLRDSSTVYKSRLDLMLRNAYLGLGLVFVFLALFLEIRLAFWVSLGIPVSFLGSFLFLSMTDFSINMITMFAFIVTLGIVVDDAIVAGENVYAQRRQGKNFLRAATDGAKEVAGPVTFSVLTNIVAFLPMYFVPGMMGKVFKFVPIVVTCVFLVSLIESLFILPAHLAHTKPVPSFAPLRVIDRWQDRFSMAFERFVEKYYGFAIETVMRNRYIVLALGAALIIGMAGYIKSGRMGMELFPRVESDYAIADATLPYGAPEEAVREVERLLLVGADKVVQEHGGERLSTGVMSVVSENSVNVRIYLADPEIRTLNTTEVTRLWREAVGPLAGLESISYESDRGGPGSGKGLTIQLSHRDTRVLDRAGEELADELANFAGVSDIDDGSAQGKRQYDVKLTPLGEALGISSREVASQIRNAFYGSEAVRQQRGGNEVTVRVRLPEKERRSEATLTNMVLRLSDGREVMLRDVADVEATRAYTSITRTGGRRVASVTANVTPRSRTETLVTDLQATVLPALVEKHPGLTYTFEGHQAELRDSVSSLIQGLLLALLGIYALLAIPFKSYVQPLIIMISIPFGLIGAVFGHLIMGYTLSVMSLFGVVALSGVVVNDSLVLIDFANRRRREGLTAHDAFKAAGIQRFRPVMLTTITTFGGLAPMIWETSRQARFLIPMAISLGFGILFATLITLGLVPALYMALEDVLSLFRRAPEPNPKDGPTETRTSEEAPVS